VEDKNLRSLLGVGEGGQLNQDSSSQPARALAGYFKKISAVSTGHYPEQRKNYPL
jgi:hypothetical protein